MASFVFYCVNCKQPFAGEVHNGSERPCCPDCKKKTLSTGISKEQWVEKTKEERRAILDALIKENEEREASITKREKYAQAVGVAYKEDKGNEIASLDGLYADIGKKIKGWAKWIFIAGAFLSIIGAVSVLLLAEDGWMIIVGLLALVIGPLLAWVSSWILYAFGELVDKTCENEKNTRNILKLMLENNAQKETSI